MAERDKNKILHRTRRIYRKFIENFSRIAKPLTKLTKKSEKFERTTEQQAAFELLKEKLMTVPVLKYTDFTQEFIVTTDAFDRSSVITRKGRQRPTDCLCKQNINKGGAKL